jgi:hypothetical protein
MGGFKYRKASAVSADDGRPASQARQARQARPEGGRLLAAVPTCSWVARTASSWRLNDDCSAASFAFQMPSRRANCHQPRQGIFRLAVAWLVVRPGIRRAMRFAKPHPQLSKKIAIRNKASNARLETSFVGLTGSSAVSWGTFRTLPCFSCCPPAGCSCPCCRCCRCCPCCPCCRCCCLS